MTEFIYLFEFYFIWKASKYKILSNYFQNQLDLKLYYLASLSDLGINIPVPNIHGQQKFRNQLVAQRDIEH